MPDRSRPPINIPTDHQGVRAALNGMGDEVYQVDNVLYVNPDWVGVGARTGSKFAPFATIADALVSFGDETANNTYAIFLAPGVYAGNFTTRPWIFYRGFSVGVVTRLTGAIDISGNDGITVFDSVQLDGEISMIIEAGVSTASIIHLNSIIGDGNGSNVYAGRGAGSSNFTFTNCIILNDCEIRHGAVSIDGSTVVGNMFCHSTNVAFVPDTAGNMTSVNLMAVHFTDANTLTIQNEHPTASVQLDVNSLEMNRPVSFTGAALGGMIVNHDGTSLGDNVTLSVGVITTGVFSQKNSNSFTYSDSIINDDIDDATFLDIVTHNVTGLIPGEYKVSISFVWEMASTTNSLQWQFTGDFPSPNTFQEEPSDSGNIDGWSYEFPVVITGNTFDLTMEAQTTGGINNAFIHSANIMLDRKG